MRMLGSGERQKCLAKVQVAGLHLPSSHSPRRLQRPPGQDPSPQLPPALAWHLLGDRDTLLDAVDLQLLWHCARGGPSRLAGGAVGLHW